MQVFGSLTISLWYVILYIILKTHCVLLIHAPGDDWFPEHFHFIYKCNVEDTNFKKRFIHLYTYMIKLLLISKWKSFLRAIVDWNKNWHIWVHSKNRLLIVKWFLSLLKDFLLKIGIRGNHLKAKGLSFQILSYFCQSISFGLEMKYFVVQRKYNFEDERKKIVCYNLIINVHKPNFDKCEY